MSWSEQHFSKPENLWRAIRSAEGPPGEFNSSPLEKSDCCTFGLFCPTQNLFLRHLSVLPAP